AAPERGSSRVPGALARIPRLAPPPVPIAPRDGPSAVARSSRRHHLHHELGRSAALPRDSISDRELDPTPRDEITQERRRLGRALEDDEALAFGPLHVDPPTREAERAERRLVPLPRHLDQDASVMMRL